MGEPANGGSPRISYSVRDILTEMQKEQAAMDKRISSLETAVDAVNKLRADARKLAVGLIGTCLAGIFAFVVSVIRYGPALAKLAGGP